MTVTNPTQVSWQDPTTNVDGSPIATGEVTGYEVGVRDTTAAGSVAGTYPWDIRAPATATSELFSVLTPSLPTGKLLAVSVRANTAGVDASGNPVNSAWANEATFTLPTPAPVPNAPASVAVS